MNRSVVSKPPRGRRNVANATGAVLTGNGQIRIDLNKDFLNPSHQINVGVSQTWGTAAPSSSDVRRFFSKMELVSNEGTIFSCDFHQFYDQSRFTKGFSGAPVIALGAGGGAAATAQFSVGLHHLNDGSTLDILTALQSGRFSTLALVLTVSPDASNGFIGGTGAVGAAAYTVSVDSVDLPRLTGNTKELREKIVYGHARHWYKQMKEVSSASSAASNQEVLLETGNRTRFIFIHSYNTTGAIPVLANGIVDKVSLSVKGVDYLGAVSFVSMQQENTNVRNFSQTGVAVLDMGEDPKGWIPLEDVSEAKMKYSTLSTAPAGWKVTVAQDFTTGLDRLGV